MMVRYLKPGDRVQERSGGPVMTVLKYIEEKEPLVGVEESDEFVECEWFDKEGPHKDVFNQKALVKIEPTKEADSQRYYKAFNNMMNNEKGVEDAMTLSEAIQFLNSQGYRSEFVSGPNFLTEVKTKKRYKPEDLKIVKVFRFEGNEGLEDMSVLYAIESKDGEKGWLADAYGVYANPYLQKYIDRIQMNRDIKG